MRLTFLGKFTKMEAEQEQEGKIVNKYVCEPCGYVYDPEIGDPDSGVAAGTAFEDLPEDWVCPVCAVGKDLFTKE